LLQLIGENNEDRYHLILLPVDFICALDRTFHMLSLLSPCTNRKKELFEFLKV